MVKGKLHHSLRVRGFLVLDFGGETSTSSSGEGEPLLLLELAMTLFESLSLIFRRG